MRVGDEITVEPHELVAGGSALARVDGLPVFATNLFPGDVARVRITETKKGYARAELVETVRPSTLRRVQPCPIAEECGGCDWTALRLDAQLAAKERILRESLRRIGKIDARLIPAIDVHPSPLNYRLRSRLHRDGDATGFYAMRSNRVVPLSNRCEVVGLETAKAFGSEAAASAAPREERAAHAPDFEIWEVDGRLIEGDADIEIEAGPFPYRLSTGAFFQVNRHLLATMQSLVLRNAARAAERATGVDLYGGVGFFSAPLATVFESVTCVEGSRHSARWARRNVPRTVHVVNEAVEEWVEQMPRADFVFLDPPRAGARRNVIERVAERTRSVICFLACDPVTFARDASRLIASGWRLSTLDLLDLFPNTHHVETLSSFERAT